MFRKENPCIFCNKVISKEFLAFKGFDISSRKELGEEQVKNDIQGVFLI